MNSQTPRIALLAHEVSPTVSQHLVPEARTRGYVVDVINVACVDLTDFFHDPVIQSLASYDLVYYRTGLTLPGAYLLAHHLRERGVKTVNLAHDRHPFIEHKMYQAVIAAEGGVRMARTLFDQGNVFEDIASALGTPFVMKGDVSSQGRDVHLVQTETEYHALVNGSEQVYLCQEYVPHQCDCRVHIVGGEVVAMYERVPASGEFRSNVSQGGSMRPVDDSRKEEVARLGADAAKCFGFEIAAVDFLVHTESGELYFSELNMNPGWEPSDTLATGVDLTAITLDYFAKRCA